MSERLEAERRGAPFVLYRDADGGQRLVDLGERADPLCIGRQASCEIALDWDPEVSRVHALLEPVGEEWTLVDDGLSRNGSFVNGERVHGHRRLRDGDSISIGQTLLVFADTAGGNLRPTDTTRDAAPPELSVAQRRVLEELCRPFRDSAFATAPSNREIADALFISVDTVKSHLHALFEAFGIDDMPQNRKRAELARRAFARGVVSA